MDVSGSTVGSDYTHPYRKILFVCGVLVRPRFLRRMGAREWWVPGELVGPRVQSQDAGAIPMRREVTPGAGAFSCCGTGRLESAGRGDWGSSRPGSGISAFQPRRQHLNT